MYKLPACVIVKSMNNNQSTLELGADYARMDCARNSLYTYSSRKSGKCDNSCTNDCA